MTKKDEKPFYKKRLNIILLFILVPFVGIPLLFLYTSRPSKKIKIGVSVLWSIVWVLFFVIMQSTTYRTYVIDNKNVTISCSTHCIDIENYGDKDTLKILATMGVERVMNAPSNLTDGKASILVKSPMLEAGLLTIEISNKKTSRIHNTDYPEIVFYADNPDEKIAKYPATSMIESLKKDKQIAENKIPSSTGTAEICEKSFHKQFPFSGSEVHSLVGVITNDPSGPDTRLYKVGVTIENGYGASYEGEMECIVKKTGGDIMVDSFNINKN